MVSRRTAPLAAHRPRDDTVLVTGRSQPSLGILSRVYEESGPDVRRATGVDRPQLTRILADAFADDPVFAHLLPKTVSRREQRLRRMIALDAARSEKRGGTWISAAGVGAAVWFPPGRWENSAWETLRDTPAWIAVFGRLLKRAGQVRTLMEAHHRKLPDHWYLLTLGVEPARQGQGIGTALLHPVLAECDRVGIPAYLEATCERNRALYVRHGFTDQEPLLLPDGGPPLYPMWREPR